MLKTKQNKVCGAVGGLRGSPGFLERVVSKGTLGRPNVESAPYNPQLVASLLSQSGRAELRRRLSFPHFPTLKSIPSLLPYNFHS